ncbi:MAG: hypothetical protein M3Y80_06320 [Verrucomicrobiota bacterium]|nr:hypothetical protein [Verrucomicrobiota bacterium]
MTGATQPGSQQFGQGGSTQGSSFSQGSQGSEGAQGQTGGSRLQQTTDKVSSAAADAWRQTKETAGTASEQAQFYIRENPVPTVIGALAVGLAIGLAIRYSSQRSEREVEVKSPFGDVNLGMLSLPFLWPFFKSVRRGYENSAEVVKDGVKEGVDRLKNVDVDDYVKPLRKKIRSWTN